MDGELRRLQTTATSEFDRLTGQVERERQRAAQATAELEALKSEVAHASGQFQGMAQEAAAAVGGERRAHEIAVQTSEAATINAEEARALHIQLESTQQLYAEVRSASRQHEDRVGVLRTELAQAHDARDRTREDLARVTEELERMSGAGGSAVTTAVGTVVQDPGLPERVARMEQELAQRHRELDRQEGELAGRIAANERSFEEIRTRAESEIQGEREARLKASEEADAIRRELHAEREVCERLEDKVATLHCDEQPAWNEMSRLQEKLEHAAMEQEGDDEGAASSREAASATLKRVQVVDPVVDELRRNMSTVMAWMQGMMGTGSFTAEQGAGGASVAVPARSPAPAPAPP